MPPGPPGPPPLPEAQVAEALQKLRVPAMVFLVGLAVQVITYLTATAWSLGIVVLLAQTVASSPDTLPAMAMFGAGALFNILSFIALGIMVVGGVRMLRARGYGWALGSAITQIAWGIVHAAVLFYSTFGLGCLLGPIELVVVLITGTVAIAVLLNRSVIRAFDAVEAHPELLEVGSARD